VDARRHSRIEKRHGTVRCGQPRRDFDFELCGLVRCESHTRKNVGWQQAQREPVRDVKNDRLVDPQSER
jgi:hypothetical protein